MPQLGNPEQKSHEYGASANDFTNFSKVFPAQRHPPKTLNGTESRSPMAHCEYGGVGYFSRLYLIDHLTDHSNASVCA